MKVKLSTIKYTGLYGVFFFLTSLFSCQGDEVLVGGNDSIPENVREGITFSLGGFNELKTRADAEDVISNLTVLLFKLNGANYFYHSRQSAQVSSTGVTGEYNCRTDFPSSGTTADKWAIVFIPNAGQVTFPTLTVGITGLEAAMKGIVSTLPVTGSNPTSYFKDNTTQDYLFPMYALKKDLTINFTGIQQLGTVWVTRMVAKFTINSVIKPDVANPLKIKKASLINVSNKGAVCFDDTQYDPVPTLPTAVTKQDYEIYTNLTATENTQTVILYSFETKNKRATGEEYVHTYQAFEEEKGIGYTYIQLTDESGKNYALPIPKIGPYPNYAVETDYLGDILRNHHYQFTIKGIPDTKYIDAYVTVIPWTERTIEVDL